MKLTQLTRARFVSAVLADCKMENYNEQRQILAEAHVYKTAPPEVQALMDDPVLVKYLTPTYCNNVRAHYRGRPVGSPPLPWPDSLREACNQLILKEDAAQRARWDLQSQLQGIARECSTLKQLQEALPNLVKYMPNPSVVVTDKKTYPVTANLSPMLTAAGWKPQVELIRTPKESS